MKFDFRDELGKLTPKISSESKIYIFGTGAHTEHILKMYKALVGINLEEIIDGFIDNNVNKQGTFFHGKPIIALTSIDISRSVVLISTAVAQFNHEIAQQLFRAGLIWRHSYFTVEWAMMILMQYEYRQFLQFKDKHRGERCFIIGNGPSLTTEDLDKLQGEITFASNKIYHAFNQTDWRPSYYLIADEWLLREVSEEINKKVTCTKFFAFHGGDLALDNAYYYMLDGKLDWKPKPHNRPSFSEEPFVLQWGATVTYDALQIAAYMGFSEIYLLGMDHHFSHTIKANGELNLGDITDHFYAEDKLVNPYYLCLIDNITAAYESAREYARVHNIKLANATRGGKLDVFERIDFDLIFS